MEFPDDTLHISCFDLPHPSRTKSKKYDHKATVLDEHRSANTLHIQVLMTLKADAK